MQEVLTKLTTANKAIAAFVAGVVVMFLTKNNIIITDELNDAIEIIIGAVITGVVVWLAPKNK